MKKINVLHIIPSLNTGGAERLTLDICNELSKNENFKVKLLILSNEIEYVIPEQIEIQVLKKKLSLSIFKKNLFDTSELEEIFVNFNPDIIHTHLFEAEILGRYKILKNCIYITHIHDNIKQYKTNLNFFKKINITNCYEKYWIFKKYKEINNHFIVISKDSEQFCLNSLPKKLKKNITYLPNAINYNKFYNEKYEIIKNEKIKIISVGSLVEKKNHIFLLEIAQKLKKENVDFEINIFGGGYLFNYLKEQILTLQLEKMVFLKGKSSQIENEFKKADFYIHPAKYEPFGLVLLEAMASGLPVISLNGFGNKDIIKHGINGFIFDHAESKEFVKAIFELNENLNLRKKIIENGYITSQKYDLKNYIKELTELYKNLYN